MKGKLRLVRGDITEQEVGAIVNAANSSLLGGGGVDGAIHSAGGPEILEACREVRRTTHPDGLPAGEAVATTAGDLPADIVIHTVGPRWRGGEGGEPKLLENAYRNSLDVAREEDCRTIAFPSISTGAYGYPVERAASIAVGTILDVLASEGEAFDEVRLVLFSEDDHEVYARALEEIRRDSG